MPSLKSFAKQAYAVLPFKQPVYKILRRLGPPPEPIYRHLHFKGVIHVEVDTGKQFLIRHNGYMIENELFWKGLHGWEPVSMKLWTRLCADSKVIFDIGANTGVYALTAQTVNPEAKVIAVEPVERVFAHLEENVRLNGYPITVINAAVSDQTGVATLYDIPESSHVLSVSLNPEWNKGSTRLRPVKVPCITVSDLLEQAEEDHVDLLKIDVETHEPAVLRGFHKILKRDKPSLLIEILNDQVAEEVTTLVEGLGYAYYNIDDVSWPPAKVEHLAKSNHFNFLICQPAVAEVIGL